MTATAAAAATAMSETDLKPFRADYAPDERKLVESLLTEASGDPVVEKLIDHRARGYIGDMRAVQVGLGGVEDFMREFGLTTREGLAMMVLAEALLRVPDAATAYETAFNDAACLKMILDWESRP